MPSSVVQKCCTQVLRSTEAFALLCFTQLEPVRRNWNQSEQTGSSFLLTGNCGANPTFSVQVGMWKQCSLSFQPSNKKLYGSNVHFHLSWATRSNMEAIFILPPAEQQEAFFPDKPFLVVLLIAKTTEEPPKANLRSYVALLTE